MTRLVTNLLALLLLAEHPLRARHCRQAPSKRLRSALHRFSFFCSPVWRSLTLTLWRWLGNSIFQFNPPDHTTPHRTCVSVDGRHFLSISSRQTKENKHNQQKKQQQ